MTYTIDIAGVKRDLQLFKVNDNLQIAAMILFGDVELTVKSAEELLKIAPQHDIMITSEAKSIPLIHEMARQSGVNEYVIARKSVKVYMEDIIDVTVNSITTQKEQKLYLGKKEIDMLKGKRCLIVDDVISTGKSLECLEELVTKAGGKIVGKMAVLAEGDASLREDIKFLNKLPLFDKDGNVIE